MANEEIEVQVDAFDKALLEIEARRRGVDISQVATERFIQALDEEIEFVKQAFLGAKSPSKALQ